MINTTPIDRFVSVSKLLYFNENSMECAVIRGIGLVLAAFLFAGCGREDASAAQDTSSDLPGWQNTRWGMDPDQVREIVPGLGEIEAMKDGKEQIKLPEWQIGECHFDVTFSFTSDKRLEMVSLGSLEHGEQIYRCKLSVNQLLVEKYGQPTTQEKKDIKYFGHNDHQQWMFASTTISLFLLQYLSGNEDHLTIMYKGKIDPSLDKI
jgi:hypothetical protein